MSHDSDPMMKFGTGRPQYQYGRLARTPFMSFRSIQGDERVALKTAKGRHEKYSSGQPRGQGGTAFSVQDLRFTQNPMHTTLPKDVRVAPGYYDHRGGYELIFVPTDDVLLQGLWIPTLGNFQLTSGRKRLKSYTEYHIDLRAINVAVPLPVLDDLNYYWSRLCRECRAELEGAPGEVSWDEIV